MPAQKGSDRKSEKRMNPPPLPVERWDDPGREILKRGTRSSHDNTDQPMDWAQTLGWMARNMKMRRGHGKTMRERLAELMA